MKRRDFSSKTAHFRRRLAVLLLACFLFPFSCPLGIHSVAAYPSMDPSVDSWDIVGDGGAVTFSLSGKAANPEYLAPYVQLTYEDGSTGVLWLTLRPAENACDAVFTNNDPWSQTNLNAVIDGKEDGTYSVVVTIPAEVFGGKRFAFDFSGASVSSADIPGYSQSGPGTASSPEPSPSAEPSASPTPTEESSSSPVPSASPGAASSPGPGSLTPNVRGRIVVDGDLSDWANISGITGGGKMTEWKLARDTDGNVYFALEGSAMNQWDEFYRWEILRITQNGQTQDIQLENLKTAARAEVEMVNEANGSTAGPCYVEAMIPASYFTDPNFTITFSNASQPAANLPVIDGQEVEAEEPVYHGIVIDGRYRDWDAVAKYPVNDAALDSAAMVFDGDMVYLYLKENPGMSAAGAGPSHNGQYAITTDLGNKLVFQLKPDGTVNGAEGAEVKHVGAQWEISAPASKLPKYKDTISFGLYLTESEDYFVKDVANLNGEGSGGSFNGIVYDGIYTDWDYYPHTAIGYSGPGTGEEMADAMGALWLSENTLFGHFVTTLPAHVKHKANNMMHGINFLFSGAEFSPMLIQVGDDGTILKPSPNGDFTGSQEFYLLDRAGYGVVAGQNISELQGNYVCGRITITVTDDKVECEFTLDLETLGEKLGCDFKEIKCQFARLGKEWVTIQGTPTGPLLGVALCVLVAAGVLACRKRKQARSDL